MKTRIIVAVIFLPLIFITLFFLEPIFVTIMMSAIGALAAFELLRSVAPAMNVRIYIYVSATAAALPVGVLYGMGEAVFRAILFLLTFAMFIEAIAVFKTEKEIGFGQIAVAIFGGAVIPYFLSAIVSLKLYDDGRLYVLLPFLTTFTSDSGAYFTGVFFGKRKATPNISPNKTVEGFIGGIISGIAAMLIYGLILQFAAGRDVNFVCMAVYGFLGSIVAAIGDLAFSLIKREYGIKDYGKLLPGHGGMLDRFDSMVFAAPAVYLLTLILPAF